MMRKLTPLLLLTLIPALLYAAPDHKNMRAKTSDLVVPVMCGSEPVMGRIVYPPYDLPRGLDEMDLIGDTTVIGMTWYENQHNGTIGRMLDLSEDGYIHFSWMKGYYSDFNLARHVWYNAMNLATGDLVFPEGTPVDASSRAGFTTLDAAYGGLAFPAFHEIATDVNPHTAVAFDLSAHTGAFTPIEPEWLYDEYGAPRQILWPHMMFDNAVEPTMHIVSTEQVPNAGDPQRQYYTPGVYDPLSYTINFPTAPDSAYRMISWTMTIAGDVATSPVSDRTIFAWTYPLDEGFPELSPSQLNNDIRVLIDDDGQDFHFEDYFNLTNFAPPNLDLFPDTTLALMDTLRAYTDLNVFIDQDDYAHVLFTTRYVNAIDSPNSSYWNASAIWHWSEQYPNEFRLIHNAFDEWWEGLSTHLMIVLEVSTRWI